MRLQHIISTMGRRDFQFLEALKCQEDILVVNQKAECNSQRSTMLGHCRLNIVNSMGIGLSNSRNLLLSHADGDVCILGDDDLTYREDYNRCIVQAYKDYPNADIIVFRFSEDATMDTRRQFGAPKRLNLLDISKVASVEITFKLKSVVEAGLRFDPRIGLGTPIGFGEENAFLADALRAGLTIQYVPFTICHSVPAFAGHKHGNGFDEEYFRTKGACFYRIYGKYWLLFSMAFVALKAFTTFRGVNCFKALRWISSGEKVYLQGGIKPNKR